MHLPEPHFGMVRIVARRIGHREPRGILKGKKVARQQAFHPGRQLGLAELILPEPLSRMMRQEITVGRQQRRTRKQVLDADLLFAPAGGVGHLDPLFDQIVLRQHAQIGDHLQRIVFVPLHDLQRLPSLHGDDIGRNERQLAVAGPVGVHHLQHGHLVGIRSAHGHFVEPEGAVRTFAVLLRRNPGAGAVAPENGINTAGSVQP